MMSDKMIGYCGYSCHLCAARSDEPKVRKQLVEGWKKIFGHQQYTTRNVKCDGCRTDGKIADKDCKARPCAIKRGVDSCALCDKFVCSKVRRLLTSREGMIMYLHKRVPDITEDEYNLCVRQFESMPTLVKIMVNAGKVPSWLM